MPQPTLNDIRSKYPQYGDLSDAQLADALYNKHYSDMPRDQFNERLGLESVQRKPAQEQSYASGMVDMIVNGLTLGHGDHLVAAEAAVLGKTPDGDVFNYEQPFKQRYQTALDAEKAQNRQFREDRPISAFAGEVVGSILSGAAAINIGARAARHLSPDKSARIASTLYGRMAASAGAGSGLGAVSAAGNDTDITQGALLGALGGGAGQVLGEGVSAGVQRVGRAFRKRPQVPSLDDIRAQESASYAAADNAGVILSPQAMKRLRSNASQDLADMAFDPLVDPKIGAAMRRVDDVQGQNVTLKGLRPIRKAAGRAAGSVDREERRMGVMLKNQVDDLVVNPQAGDVIAGDAPLASQSLAKARDMSTRRFKVEELDNLLEDASKLTATSGSGGNIDNASRAAIRKALKKSRNYTPDEAEAAERVIVGTRGQNALRTAGKISPSGNGLMAMLNLMGGTMNPRLLAAPVAGVASKGAADAMTQKNIEALSRIIRAGGSKVAAEGAPTAIENFANNPRLRSLIARAVLASSMQQQVAP